MSLDTTTLKIIDAPPYLFCALLGMFIAIAVFIILISRKGYKIERILRCLVVSIVSLIISAKLFGYLSGIYRDIGRGNAVTIEGIKDTGIVFYGGLFGLLITFVFLLKQRDIDLGVVDSLAVVIPLFHAIARIGCFTSGCCYGMEYHGFMSVEYTTIIEGMSNTTRRIPIQIISCVMNLALFFYLLSIHHRDDWREKHILIRYLIFYAVGRYIVEFFRGDVRRGIIHGVSFSQTISVLTIIGVVTYMIMKRSKK